MRIDQYLWAVRYFKSRSIATKACKKGQVRVNDQVVKPSREVFPMDKIILRKEQVNLTLDVLDIPKSRVGAKLVDLYRVNTTPKDAFKQNELQNLAQDYYRQKGEGRPTKKDSFLDLMCKLKKVRGLFSLKSSIADPKLKVYVTFGFRESRSRISTFLLTVDSGDILY